MNQEVIPVLAYVVKHRAMKARGGMRTYSSAIFTSALKVSECLYRRGNSQ
jgi:hypothetical protein